MQSIEPGIHGFPDVQLHIWGLVLAHHPGMTVLDCVVPSLLAITTQYGLIPLAAFG